MYCLLYWVVAEQTLPCIFLAIEVNAKVLRIEVNDGRVLILRQLVFNTYIYTEPEITAGHQITFDYFGSCLTLLGQSVWTYVVITKIKISVNVRLTKFLDVLSGYFKNLYLGFANTRLYIHAHTHLSHIHAYIHT